MLEPKKYSGQMLGAGHTIINFCVDFVPTTLNDQEVYEVKKGDDHYCYMTSAMVDKIFKLIPGGKNRYVDQFSFDLEDKEKNFVKLKNKLLLDLPDNVDANSFSSMSFPFVEYTKDVKKEPVVLKVKRDYKIDNLDEDGGAIELIFPNNKIECNIFKIYSQEKIDKTIEIDARNDKADTIFIDKIMPKDVSSQKVHLSVKFKEEMGTLFVQDGVIPYVSGAEGHINFKTGKSFHLRDSKIDTIENFKNVNSINFNSSKEIYIDNSSVIFQNIERKIDKGKSVGIDGNGDINICDSVCEIDGLLCNNGGVYVSRNKKSTNAKRNESKIKISDSTFNSPVYIKTLKDKPLVVKSSLVNNEGNKTTISGNTLVLNSEILGDNNKPITIHNSSVRLSEITNTNDLREAFVSKARLENCVIENDKDNIANIAIGPQRNNSMSQVLEDEDTNIAWSLKNCQIKVGKDSFFRTYNFEEGKIIAENSTFNNGFLLSFYIDENEKDKIKDFILSIKNSLINNCAFRLTKSSGNSFMATSVVNSEINDTVGFTDLELLQNSVANYNTYLVGYKKVESCFLDGVEKEAREGEYELIGFNPNASSYVEEPGKNVGTATHDVEIL